MDIREQLQLVLNTVLTVKTDGADGNWNKLLGIVNTLRQIITKLDEEKEDAAHGENH